MRNTFLAALAALTLATAASAEIRGHYLETRNAEIYASHCFANSEAGIRGDLAILAWSIDAGDIDGVNLKGLRVVAVVKASSTIGDPFGNPLPAKTVLIVDRDASAEQKVALEKLVHRSAGELVRDIVRVEALPIDLDFHGDMHAKRATLTAGDAVKVTTRAIEATDSLCHLDNIYYQPMVELDHAMAAHATQQSFHGAGLNVRLDEYRRSSVYLGTFTMNGTQVTD